MLLSYIVESPRGCVSIANKNSLLEARIGSTLMGHGIYSIKGRVSRIINCFSCSWMNPSKDSLVDSRYLVYFKMVSFTHLFSPIRLTHKRLTTLCLTTNWFRCAASSHSYLVNKKQRYSMRLPGSLLQLHIGRNDIFRLVCKASLKSLRCDVCPSINEVKLTESVLCVSQFLTYHRKLKTRQKSIRRYELAFRVLQTDEYKSIEFGYNGLSNDFIHLTKGQVFVKPIGFLVKVDSQ